MSTNHKLIIIKDMNKHHVEIVCDEKVYRIAMRFGKPWMIFDMANRTNIKIPKNMDILSLLNYGTFNLIKEGIMSEESSEKFVYLVYTFPESSKMNWHADCLDFVEYTYGYPIQYDKTNDVYYIVANEELDILELNNDHGIVAILEADENGKIELDDN
jgi:hypothetical protein